MLNVRVETIIATEPAQVWSVLVDYERMDTWTGYAKVVRCRPGPLDPNGVGAVRRLHAPGRVMEERITRFDVGRRLEYDVLRGAPGWATKGQITLTPTAKGGTLVCWTIRLHPYLPFSSWLIRRFLQRALESDLQRLKARLTPELLLAFEKAKPQSELAPGARAKRGVPARPRTAREILQELR